MKKLLTLLALAALCTSASANFCRGVAEHAMSVKVLANAGGSFESVVKGIDLMNMERQYKVVAKELATDAYYGWASFPEENVKQLAYLKCKQLMDRP